MAPVVVRRWLRPVMLVRLAVLLLIVVLVLYNVLYADWRPRHLKDVRDGLVGFGVWASVVVILVQALGVLLFIPGFFVIIATALLFGPHSIWISLLGQTLGATACYWVAHFVGREPLQDLVGQRLLVIERIVEDHGFRYLLYLRLISVLPLSLAAYAPGLFRMRFAHFVAAIALGEAPFIIVVGLFGDTLAQIKHLEDLLKTKFLFPVIAVGALFTFPLLVAVILRRIQLRRRPPPGPPSPPDETLQTPT